MIPNWAITRRICTAIRAGRSMDLACTDVGVDAPTLKRWLALGEAAYKECEEEDPHCRFFEAFIKALEYADQAAEAARQRPAEPEPEPSPRPRTEPRRTLGNRSSEPLPIAWVVVEEAPIEIVIGSRPPWVYETTPTPTPVRPPEPPQPVWVEDAPSEDMPTTPAEVDEAALRRDPTLEQVAEAVGVIVGVLVVLIAIVVLALVVFPIMLASFALIGAFRLALALAYRWRAGVLALRGGELEGLPIPSPVARNALGRRLRPLVEASFDRTSGSVALAGRLRPQRE